MSILSSWGLKALQQQFSFYTWDEHTGEVRWMCSFDTSEHDIDAFAAAIAEEIGIKHSDAQTVHTGADVDALHRRALALAGPGVHGGDSVLPPAGG